MAFFFRLVPGICLLIVALHVHFIYIFFSTELSINLNRMTRRFSDLCVYDVSLNIIVLFFQGSVVNMNVMQPIYKWFSRYFHSCQNLGMALYVGNYTYFFCETIQPCLTFITFHRNIVLQRLVSLFINETLNWGQNAKKTSRKQVRVTNTHLHPTFR